MTLPAVRARALVLLLCLASAGSVRCRRIEPPVKVPEPVAQETPAPDIEVRLRLFERLSPRRLLIQGALLLMPGTPFEHQASSVALSVDQSMVAIDDNPLAPTVYIEASEGDLRIDAGGPFERNVSGRLEVQADHGALEVVATLPLEDYVAGVVAAELEHGGPEALRAQAVLARTFVLKERPRHEGYDVCDLTHCQAFKGLAKPRFVRAARDTAGRVLSADGGQPAHVFYASTCGGHTASYRTLWPSRDAPSYLVGVPDLTMSGRPWCRSSPHMTWTFSVDEAVLAGMLEEEYGQKPRIPLKIGLVYGPGEWVARVKVKGIDAYITGEAFHLLLAREFGWGKFKSARFTFKGRVLTERGSRLEFSGRGLGHGVGLCQYGAMSMDRAGLSWEAILEHYFPRLKIIRWPTRCTDDR